jgi:hypothetical protein
MLLAASSISTAHPAKVWLPGYAFLACRSRGWSGGMKAVAAPLDSDHIVCGVKPQLVNKGLQPAFDDRIGIVEGARQILQGLGSILSYYAVIIAQGSDKWWYGSYLAALAQRCNRFQSGVHVR